MRNIKIKKRNISLCILIIVLVVSVIYLFKSPKIYYSTIEYDELLTKIKSKDDFILVIGRNDCPYCDDLINNIQKDIDSKKMYVSYLEIKPNNKELKDGLIKQFGDFEYVPHVIYFKNGIVVKIKPSEIDSDIYIDFWEV